MKALKYALVLILVLGLAVPAAGEVPDDVPDFGTLYGDLYVILRDEYGRPILADNGCIQPISGVEAEVAVLDYVYADPEDPVGDPVEINEIIISAEVGEPFALPTYTDIEGDLVECELTEEMAEWVQTVDFGRLNLGRAPYSVIAHAFDEAINKMNAAQWMGIDPAGRLILTIPDEDGDWVAKTIDSPAENLALYIKMMVDGHWITVNTDPVEPGGQPIEVGGRPEGKGKPTDDPDDPADGDGPTLEDRPVLSEAAIALLDALGYGGLGDDSRTTGEQLTQHELVLAASLLAAAADKTGSITLDKVMYINSIYGINQIGTLDPVVEEGETYFDFGVLSESEPYDRAQTFGSRASGPCEGLVGLGWIWVIQPEKDAAGVEVPDHFVSTCIEILGYENSGHDPSVNAVHFTDMVEAYTTVELDFDFTDNVRAFVQAADDALQVLEYIHNYKVPEALYADE